MLYDNDGRELDALNLVYEFRNLEPVDSLARRYNISEEQVFEVVGGGALVKTENARYHFNFEASPPTVRRRPGPGGTSLPGDDTPLPLLTTLRWGPRMVIGVVLPGNDFLTVRTTSTVLEVAFYD